MIDVLFDQRVIPNYRVGILGRLAAIPDLSLVVSYWTDRFLDRTPHADGALGFETVAFTPLHLCIRGKDYWFNVDLIRYVIKNKPHVVIGPLAMFGFNSMISKVTEDLLGLLFGTRFVYRVSFGRWPGKPNVAPRGLRRIWYKWVYRNVIVTTYTQRAAEIAVRNGCNPDRVLVDYNAMDSDELLAIRTQLTQTLDTWRAGFLRQYGIAGDGYVLFASRILPQKRLDVLIEAWERIVEQVDGVQLVVVGSGPAKEQAVQQAAAMSDRVIFVDGIYDTGELAKFYCLASMVVFPGYNTLSTHFAMCLGKPIVASQYGNEAEYVQDGVNGFTYDYGNARELAEKIVVLLRDASLQDRFGAESDRIVREQINIEHMVNTIACAIQRSRVQ